MVLSFGMPGLAFKESDNTGDGLVSQLAPNFWAWKLVEQKILTDATSATFTGLNQERYMLVIEVDCADSSRVVSLVINGTGAGESTYQYTKAATATLTAAGNTAATQITLIESTPGATLITGDVIFCIGRTGASSYPTCRFNIFMPGYTYSGGGSSLVAATTFSSIKFQIDGGDMSGKLTLYSIQ